MNRMTCRNGFIFVAAICLGLIVTFARGGSLDAPAAPTNAASAMWTLENIYNVLDTRTTNVTKRTVVFTEPSSGPISGTMHTLDDIMMLVTNRAPVTKTGQTTSYKPYDDGWYGTNLGVASPNPRFTVQADTNVVLDNLTGLMWVGNMTMFSVTNWGPAVSNCNALTYGGFSDWRLPNKRELLSLIDDGQSVPALPPGHPFTGFVNNNFWSSTTRADYSGHAWTVNPHYGMVNFSDNVSEQCQVWPVRGGR